MRKLLSVTLPVLLFLGMVSCGTETPEPSVITGNAFGTTYAIQYYADESFDAEKGIDSVIYAVNKSVSTYLPESDISKINRGDSTVVVDPIFKEVFRISEVVYTNSKGFFDPTIGVLRNAYGFGDEKPLAKIDSTRLDSLRRLVGFRKVEITAEGTVRKRHPNIYFDFNAVAKGYGIDRLGAFLEANGVKHYLIELGGELLAKGQNQAKEQPWVVGVEAVDSPLEERAISAKVRLQDRGMAASGNYRKFRIDSLTGQKFVHTINPHTGLAVASDVTSATVLAPSCALADAYATAFMAMGLDNSKRLLQELSQIEAYLTYLDKSGQTGTFITKGFQEELIEEED